jgi:hypothetical protein
MPSYPYIIDEFQLPLHARLQSEAPRSSSPPPELRQDADSITVSGKSFKLKFSRQSGQIVEAVSDGELLLTGGPVLNLTPLRLLPITVKSCEAYIVPGDDGHSGRACIAVKGSHGGIGVEYSLLIDGDGWMDVKYTVTQPPSAKQKYDEVGLMFIVPEGMNRLSWERKGLWSVYPKDHIGRNEGAAIKVRPGPLQQYREKPTWPWYHDMNDFHLLGKNQAGYGMTHDFRAAREYIYWEEIYRDGAPGRLRIESDGKTHAVRVADADPLVSWIFDDRHPSVRRSGEWQEYGDPKDIFGTELYSEEKGAFVECCFSGKHIAWIGARNNNMGKADVYIDGICAARGVDAFSSKKEHAQVLFRKTDLADKNHVIRIVVTGEKSSASLGAYVLVDAFSDEFTGSGLSVHINRDWSYGLGWGNYNRRTKTLKKGFTDTIRLKL